MQNKNERWWAFWFGLGLMILTSLPYITGYFMQNQDWRYSGLVLAEEDGYSYLAKMLGGANGAWLFRTPYTLANQQGFLGFLPYILLGKLTSTPGQHEQLVALFHLFRIAGGVLACVATYDFISIFVHDIGLRRIATGVAMAGGGLGILALLGLGAAWGGPMPLEYYSPETFGFLGFLAIPHLAWARALLLWGLVSYLSSPGWRGAILAGFLWLCMGFFQPLVVVVGWVVLGAHFVGIVMLAWQKHLPDGEGWRAWFGRAAVVGGISSPIVFYNFAAFRLDPFLNLWEKQNYLPSPPLTDYLLAYGVLLPLAVIGIIEISKAISSRTILLLTWMAAFPVLAYLPYNLQRRLPEGLWVALAVVAVIGLGKLSLQKRKAAAVWLAIGFLPSVILVSLAFRSATTLAPPSFQPAGEVKAFGYFASQFVDNPAVLAAYDTSTLLPAYASVRVPIGHGPESLGLNELRPRVEGFFRSDLTDEQRKKLLNDLKIDYVFYGPMEQELGGFKPQLAGYLTSVFNEGRYEIFKVGGNLDR